MKRFVFVCCLLGLTVPAPSSAQQVVDQWVEGDDDYDAYFGSHDGGSVSEDDGPEDLQQALEEGRGYRIGGGGRYASDAPPPSRARGVHRVREGETLWDISDRYYNDPMQWPRLWSYNPEITNPHWIYPDSEVRLVPEAQKTPMAPTTEDASPTSTPVDSGPALSTRRGRARGGEPGAVFLRDQGYLGPDGLAAAGTLTASRNERVMLSRMDEVYVRFEEGAQVRPGQEYSVFRPLQPIEREPNAQGVVVRVFGTVAIRSYDADKRIARGVITEAVAPIERGSQVAMVDKRFLLVPPKRNEANVVAHIAASLEPHMMISDQDVVFLDVGAKQGVQVGNRFFVVRRGDPYLDDVRGPAHHTGVMPLPKYEKQDYPKEVVAELRIVRVQEGTAVALVTRADVDLEVGDLAEMRVGF